MAVTPSTMLPLGTELPDFSLTDTVTGKTVSSKELVPAEACGALVMFICNHCPYVIHIRQALVRLSHEALDQGFSVVAINANSVKTHPQDGPENMKRLALDEGWRFPFLFDATQEVAHAFRAACTPDFYVFDKQRRLAYRGQMDDSRPSNGVPVTGKDLRAALEAVGTEKAPSANQKPSIGCNIKWAPGASRA